ncbi:hypothetical protein [Microbacterium sp. zg-YB36]|uniref:hypothetical protein n=1 Tax=Microbacterium sp. zg-YB36 TaxID=2969407 RepID=UPI00214C3D42|nr:hypothetical protein [Microbacterium sp. zg-YB36]MDL5351137.1 hypothetical protein [Microbacterium sp. zg-YB36]
MTEQQARDEVGLLFARFDAFRNSGICSPTTRGLLDDAERLLRRVLAKATEGEQ